MHFEFRDYQLLKIKQNLKNKFLLFSNGANQTSQNWLIVEQNLSDLNLKYYKIYNKIALEVFKNSIYKNISQTIRGTFFFLRLKTTLDVLKKQNLFKVLESICFTLLSIKLNNKIYSIVQIKNIKSLKYKHNVAVLYQFLLTNLKHVYRMNNKKISKQCDLNTWPSNPKLDALPGYAMSRLSILKEAGFEPTMRKSQQIYNLPL